MQQHNSVQVWHVSSADNQCTRAYIVHKFWHPVREVSRHIWLHISRYVILDTFIAKNTFNFQAFLSVFVRSRNFMSWSDRKITYTILIDFLSCLTTGTGFSFVAQIRRSRMCISKKPNILCSYSQGFCYRFLLSWFPGMIGSNSYAEFLRKDFSHRQHTAENAYQYINYYKWMHWSSLKIVKKEEPRLEPWGQMRVKKLLA